MINTSWVVECDLSLNVSTHSIRFAEAVLLWQGRIPPLATSWAQSLCKQESGAFNKLNEWWLILPIYFLLQAFFPSYLHICMSGINFCFLQYHFLMETSRLRWEKGGGRTKDHISSAFQSTTSFSSNSWSELLMNNGWWPDEYAHSLLRLWGLVNNLWAKMFLTLLLYKNYGEKNHIFTLWAGRVICQSDSSLVIQSYFIAKIKVNRIKYTHFRVGGL